VTHRVDASGAQRCASMAPPGCRCTCCVQACARPGPWASRNARHACSALRSGVACTSRLQLPALKLHIEPFFLVLVADGACWCHTPEASSQPSASCDDLSYMSKTRRDCRIRPYESRLFEASDPASMCTSSWGRTYLRWMVGLVTAMVMVWIGNCSMDALAGIMPYLRSSVYYNHLCQLAELLLFFFFLAFLTSYLRFC